ncbi:MAG: hypothetical protein ACP5NL_05610 [Thermoplasmata archaeon]
MRLKFQISLFLSFLILVSVISMTVPVNSQSSSGYGILHASVWPLSSSILINNTTYFTDNGTIITSLESGSYYGNVFSYGFLNQSISFNILANKTTSISVSLKPVERMKYNYNFSEYQYPDAWKLANQSYGTWLKGKGYNMLNVSDGYNFESSVLIMNEPVYGSSNDSFTFISSGGENYDFGVQIYGIFPTVNFYLTPSQNTYGYSQNGYFMGLFFNPYPTPFIISYNGTLVILNKAIPLSEEYVFQIITNENSSKPYVDGYINKLLIYNFSVQLPTEPYLSAYSGYYGSGENVNIMLLSADINFTNPPLSYTEGYVSPQNTTIVQENQNIGWSGWYYTYGISMAAPNGYYVTVYTDSDNMSYYISNGYITYTHEQKSSSWLNVSLSPVSSLNSAYNYSGSFNTFPYDLNISPPDQVMQYFSWISQMSYGGGNVVITGPNTALYNISESKISLLSGNELSVSYYSQIYKNYIVISGRSFYNYPMIEIFSNNTSSPLYITMNNQNESGNTFGYFFIKNYILYVVSGTPFYWSPSYEAIIYEYNITTGILLGSITTPIPNLYPIQMPYYATFNGLDFQIALMKNNGNDFVYAFNLTKDTWTNETIDVEQAFGQSQLSYLNDLIGVGNLSFFLCCGELAIFRNSGFVALVSNQELMGMNMNDITYSDGYYFITGSFNEKIGSIPGMLGLKIYGSEVTVNEFPLFYNHSVFEKIYGNSYGIGFPEGLLIFYQRYGPYDSNLFSQIGIIRMDYSRLELHLNPANGSDVYINGKELGQNNSGSISIFLKAGEANILVTNPNYYSYNETVFLNPDTNNTAWINLTKAVSFLQGTISPGRATLFISNNVVNITNGSFRIPIMMGSYPIRASARYYVSYKGNVIVNYGINWLNISMLPASGFLMVSVNVENTTMLIGTNVTLIKGYKDNISLYPGFYNITLIHTYYNDIQIKNILITSNNTTYISANLNKANGTLIVHSFTSNSSLYLNSRYMGTGRDKYNFSLAPGQYWINATAPQHFGFSLLSSVTSDNITVVNISLQRFRYVRGYLNVENFVVICNNVSYIFQGNSYNLTVGSGNYTLVFMKEYYSDITIKIHISNTTEIYWQNVSMTMRNGTLLLNVQGYYGFEHHLFPQIFYEGSSLKYSILNITGESYQELNLTPGYYSVYLILPSWNSTQISFSITAENYTNVSVIMNISWGKVVIISNIQSLNYSIENPSTSGNILKYGVIENGSSIMLYPGNFTFIFSADHYLPQNFNITVNPNTTQILYINMTRATSYLKGTLSPSSGSIIFDNEYISVTNGSFMISTVPGTYSISFNASSSWFEPISMSVSLKLGMNWLNVTLKRFVNVTVQLNGVNGLEISGINVSLTYTNQNSNEILKVSGTTNSSGTVRFMKLPQGPYIIFITGKGVNEEYSINVNGDQNQLFRENVYTNQILNDITAYISSLFIFSVILLYISSAIEKKVND